jgi:hypothetical protein
VPRKCSICSHKKRCQIDESLINNAEYSGLAREYRVSEDALKRHVDKGHISKVIQAAANENQIAHGKSLQEKIDEAYKLALDAAKDAKKSDLRAFGGCIGGVMKALEIEARIKGDGKPPEPPKQSGFMKAYVEQGKKFYAKDQSTAN